LLREAEPKQIFAVRDLDLVFLFQEEVLVFTVVVSHGQLHLLYQF
jgi:hypothetical protein